MKLSISNIAWDSSLDAWMYELMKKYGFSGLEIAPTRIFPEQPYDRLDSAANWHCQIRENYGLVVTSMQSIWYGRQEKLFGSEGDRKFLLEYTRRAIDFAAAIGCTNLVFGCPRNRALSESADPITAISFFKELGDYAFEQGTVIGMEANPPIYNTNYINDTMSALELIRKVDSRGFLLNLDVGTMIQNQESVQELAGSERLINHIHISEPGLKVIEKRRLHQDLKRLLVKANYQKFISIEMGRQEDISVIERTMQYVGEVFGCE